MKIKIAGLPELRASLAAMKPEQRSALKMASRQAASRLIAEQHHDNVLRSNVTLSDEDVARVYSEWMDTYRTTTENPDGTYTHTYDFSSHGEGVCETDHPHR